MVVQSYVEGLYDLCMLHPGDLAGWSLLGEQRGFGHLPEVDEIQQQVELRWRYIGQNDRVLVRSAWTILVALLPGLLPFKTLPENGRFSNQEVSMYFVDAITNLVSWMNSCVGPW